MKATRHDAATHRRTRTAAASRRSANAYAASGRRLVGCGTVKRSRIGRGTGRWFRERRPGVRAQSAAAARESQAGGLAQVQSGARRKTDLWHAAFHRVDNGTARRSAAEGRPRPPARAVAAPQLHCTESKPCISPQRHEECKRKFSRERTSPRRRRWTLRGTAFAGLSRDVSRRAGQPAYLSDTLAPPSSSFFLIASASSLATFSLTASGRLRPGPWLP